jgi:hypothetical protein
MRLIYVDTSELIYFVDAPYHDYAILSHIWGKRGATLQ